MVRGGRCLLGALRVAVPVGSTHAIASRRPSEPTFRVSIGLLVVEPCALCRIVTPSFAIGNSSPICRPVIAGRAYLQFGLRARAAFAVAAPNVTGLIVVVRSHSLHWSCCRSGCRSRRRCRSTALGRINSRFSTDGGFEQSLFVSVGSVFKIVGKLIVIFFVVDFGGRNYIILI